MDLKADQTQLRNELIKQKISQQHREQKNTEKTGNSERDTDCGIMGKNLVNV